MMLVGVPITHVAGATVEFLNLLEGGFSQLKGPGGGDIMLDRYIHGEVDRISPEASGAGAASCTALPNSGRAARPMWR